jgi:hypothetical protein
MRTAVRYFVVLLILFSVIVTISANDDQSIAVRNDAEEFSSIVTDGTTTVINGFAVDWPTSLDVTFIGRRYGAQGKPIQKEKLAAGFPEYFEDLAVARRGAELVNEFAFDTYKKIAGDGEDRLFFSPYGVYTALWEIRELWETEAQNNIFNVGDTDLLIRKLRKMIYVNFINRLTKREEDEFYSRLFYRHPSSFDLLYPHPAFDQFYLHHHPSFDLISSIDRRRFHLSSNPQGVIKGNMPMHPGLIAEVGIHIDMVSEHRDSSFNVSNSVSTYNLDSFQKYDTSLSLTNSTSLDIPCLDEGLVGLKITSTSWRGWWCGGSFLYTQTDEFELMRIRFATFKHSLLLINPKDANDFKKIEREIDIKAIKKLLHNMELKNCASRSVGALLNYYDREPTLALNLSAVTKGTPLVNFNHNVSLIIARYNLTWPYPNYPIEVIDMETLSSRYEHVIPFEHPFLFFVIDDPTGAILIMGRSSGHRPVEE